MFYGNPCGPCGPCAGNVAQPIVHPTKHCQTHTHSSTLVPHIHPTHTTVVNHHTMKHAHMYPQTTSYANTTNNVDLGAVSGIAPAPSGYGMGQGGGFGGFEGAPYSAGFAPEMIQQTNVDIDFMLPGGMAMPPAPTGMPMPIAPTGMAISPAPQYQTQLAPTPGVKEMPIFPGMAPMRRR